MLFGRDTAVLGEDPEAPIGVRGDFETFHKCRNFEKIEEWMDENCTVL